MDDDLQITLVASSDGALRARLARSVHAYGEPHVGVTASEPLEIEVRNGVGHLLGGLSGRTVHGHLLIEVLFVDESLRGRGIGRELMQRAEAEAIRRGCYGAQVDTISFQAPDFYRRLGFEVIGTVPDFPRGHERHFLHKRYR